MKKEAGFSFSQKDKKDNGQKLIHTEYFLCARNYTWWVISVNPHNKPRKYYSHSTEEKADNYES